MRWAQCVASTVLWLGLAGWANSQPVLTLTRQDGQQISATLYSPTLAACRGIAVVSHGAGGSEQGYGYLGTALASFGYLAVVIGHPESGRLALREVVRTHGLQVARRLRRCHPHEPGGDRGDINPASQVGSGHRGVPGRGTPRRLHTGRTRGRHDPRVEVSVVAVDDSPRCEPDRKHPFGIRMR